MTACETATAFFHACESGKGWEGCKEYVASGAVFTAQANEIEDINTIEAYTEWLAGACAGPLVGASYDLNSASYDADTNTALFFGTFNATHAGEGGPVPPTGKSTSSDFVYALRMDDNGKVAHMTKIWNAPLAMADLGWG